MPRSIPHLRGFLLLLALCLGAADLLHAQQGTIHGQVRESLGDTPLPDAEVRVVGGGASAVTDADGWYVLRVGGRAAVEIQVVRLGYHSQRRSVALGASDPVTADFVLEPTPLTIGEITVVGRRLDALRRVPGSAAVIGPVTLATTLPLSGNEVLRAVPGVHIQEEEGLGLRQNVGIRGLDPDRSRNVLILEDGVPVALNPYGEPEMYYTPPIDRMEGVEVVKGSGSILFGPQTVGGVINYRTPAPPPAPVGRITLLGGEGGFRRILGSYGGTWNGVGAYVSVLNRAATDIRGHHFDVVDVTGKVGFAPGARSELGLKLSLYDEVSNSTYIGLTEAMFAADARQHPAPDDRLRVRRYAVTASHALRLAPTLRLNTAAYAYTTTRNWQRQDYRYVQENRAIELLPGTGNRNRTFEVAGIEPRLQWEHRLLGVTSEMDAGARFLIERAEETYLQGSTGTSRTGELRDHEIRGGEAVSAFVQNRFIFGDLQVVPGVRVESFGFDRRVLRTRVRRSDPGTGLATRAPEDVDIRSGDRILEVVPGLGATWQASDALTLFAGVHRGFAPPRTKDALVYSDPTVPVGSDPGEVLSLQLDAERSVNSELGIRARPVRGMSLEATVFRLDFSNQIIAASASAGSVADLRTANQGETRHAGIEGSVNLDLGQAFGWPFGLTPSLVHTRVHSTFSADRFIRPLTGSELVNVRGNRLPYAPETTTILGLAVEHPRGATLRLDGTFVAEQFADNFETRDATANGRIGLIPAYRVWNLAGTYDVPIAGVTLVGTVKNLFDETYVASRRPEGIRAGTPRLVQLGARVAF
jgi:Fe(3+) dicitrate transport protein